MNIKEMHALMESLLQQGVDPITPVVIPQYDTNCDIDDPRYGLSETSSVHLVCEHYRPDISPKMAFPSLTRGGALILSAEDDVMYHMQYPTVDIDTSAMHRQASVPGPKDAVVNKSVFGGDYVSRQRVTREELLGELRRRINKGYMPSATRGGFNSKPEYVRWLDLAVEGHERAARNFDCTGYFKRTDEWGLTDTNDPIWAYIETNQFEYLVNLSNDEIRVRRADELNWVIWDDGTLQLAEDKRELWDVVENFL